MIDGSGRSIAAVSPRRGSVRQMEYAPAPSPRELEAGYRAAGFHTDVVIPRLLEQNVTEFGRSIAVIDDTREVTWAELADAAWRVAGLLQAHGIGPGDVVVWQLPNWWETLAVAHGVWAAGAISVPVVPIYREHELATIMAAVQPSAVIGPPEFRGHDHVDMLDAAARAAGVAPKLRVVIRGEATGWLTWDDTQRAAPFRHDGIDPGAPVTVGFTSGTTSGAKGAVVSTRAMLSVPMRHARGAVHVPRPRVHAGARVAHHRAAHGGLAPARVGVLGADRRAVGRAEGRHRHGAPRRDVLRRRGGVHRGARRRDPGVRHSVVPALVRLQLRGERDPSGARGAGGGAGYETAPRYGMTECPTVSASVGDDGPAIRLGTDGRILPGVDVRVVDDDRDVAPGAVGEFLVRGPQRVLGYLDPEHTRDGFDADGWFRSGDLGFVDAQGCITVTGRTKDIINRGGEKLSAQEIEALLCRHPGVAAAAVVAAPHPRLGEEPAAFMIRRPGATVSDDEVRQFLAAEGVAPQKIPRIFVHVDDLPRTASGKVKKYELVERLP